MIARAAWQESTLAATTAEVDMPDWRFVVATNEDPYSREMLQPQEPEAGKRYIAAEVKIRNGSDRPLAVSPGQIRLRDAEAIDYTNSGLVGSHPRLYDVNMLPGERVRGWMWYGVAEGVQPVELVYVPTASRLRVDVTSVSSSG